MKAKSTTDNLAALRQRAEALMKKRLPKKTSHLSESDLLKLMHELEVQQIELELQQEEFMWAEEQAAKSAAEKYAELCVFAPIGYFALSPEGKIVDLNHSGANMLGKERLRLKNIDFGSFVSDDTKPIFNQFLGKVFSINAKETCEVTLMVSGKLPIYVKLLGDVSENGEQCIVNVIDITEQKLAEEDLKLVKAKLELALQSSKMGVWEYNIAESKRSFDNQACYLLGIDPAKFSGTAEEFFAAIHPDDLEMVKAALKNTIEHNEIYQPEYRVVWSDGSVHYIAVRGKLVIDDKGIAQAIGGIIWDITEQKLADEALINERSLFRTIIDLIPEALFVKDLEGRKILANPKEVQLSGKNSEDEIIGKTDLDLFPDDFSKSALAEDQLVLQTGKPLMDIDGTLIDGEGKLHYLLVAKVPMRDLHGKIVGIVGLTRDVTERKLAEDALKESEALYRNLVLVMPDGVYKSTHDGKFIDVNPALVKMLGYDSKEELLAIDIKTQLYFEASDRESIVLQEKMEEMGIYRLKKKDGSGIWVEDHGWYNRDEKGEIISHEGITRDVTDRKQAEEDLARQQYLMQMLMDNLPDHIYFKDLENRFVRISKSHALSFGLDYPEQAFGKSDFDFFSEEHARRAYENEQTIIRTGQPLSIEEKLTYHNRPDRWVSAIKMPWFDVEGKIIGTFGMSRDVTEQHFEQEEIILKNEELRKANAEKDKFFSIIAHDLRSPFSSFLGYTEMMVEDLDSMSLNEIQTMALELKKSASNLYNLLENLLEWSRIERGISGFDPKSFLLLPKISESMLAVLESAKKKDVEISLNIPDDIMVFADENMLKSTVRNFATNAVKFTPKGGKVTLSAKSADANFVEISVRDTGIGMKKEMIDKLFKLTEHTSRPGTDGEPSSGLGLILCKDFVEKHGGKIWIESEEGKGSEFIFTIPSKSS